MYHLISHAFFKALLFMAAGNVIHAMADEQDMRRFGGMWRDLRTTSVTFLAGSLSLAGIIPFIGFFSKENVLGEAFSQGTALGYSVWAVGFLTAVLTAFYTGRMWWIAFWRPPAANRPVEHPHEAPPVMLVPVVVLGVLTTLGGLALQVTAIWPGGWHLVDRYLEPVVGTPSWGVASAEIVVTLLTLVLGAVAFAAAYRFWITEQWSAATWRARLPWLAAALERKWYFDELYDRVFVRPLDRGADGADRRLDQRVINGAVTGVASAAEAGAGSLALTQNGYTRSYLLVFLGGAVVAAAVVLFKVVSG
jgi:NADH-quinone oxidoreductase subunit L